MVVGVAVRRRSNDDVHSVEHYHRKLHTLEEIRAHPHTVGDATPSNGNGHDESANGSRNGDGDANGSGTSSEDVGAAAGHANYPASAVRMASGSSASSTSAVRLTD